MGGSNHEKELDEDAAFIFCFMPELECADNYECAKHSCQCTTFARNPRRIQLSAEANVDLCSGPASAAGGDGGSAHGIRWRFGKNYGQCPDQWDDQLDIQ